MGRYANIELDTAAEEEPVTLEEAKAHCKVEEDSEDDLITQCIKAARRYIESQWGLALCTQTHKATLDSFPDAGVKLRPFPAQELVSVGVWNGTTFALQSNDSFQLVKGRPAALFMADGGSPPQPARTRAGIEVKFTAGFGDASDVPEDIKQACFLLIGHWHANREATVSSKTGFGVSAELARGVADCMAAYRSPRLV